MIQVGDLTPFQNFIYMNTIGWIVTVDEYYTQKVQYILDTVLEELQENPHRRFMFVEQAFFQRWWHELSATKRELVRKLVDRKQLDLTVNGGWCMHDEATPHFMAMVMQTYFGNHFPKTEFNLKPTVGWQIDPFVRSGRKE